MNKDFKDTALFLAKKLGNFKYAIRGTAGLALQGFDFEVDDIDVLCDKNTALTCNDLFQEYLTTEIKYREAEQYKSFFCKFEIGGVPVDIMGDWQIRSKGIWGEVFSAHDEEKKMIVVNNQPVWVTIPEIELKMYAQMNRWNVFHILKNQITPKREELPKSLF